MKIQTLRTPGEVRQVISAGIRKSAGPFLVYFQTHESQVAPALAIQVSKKLAKAVGRNRIRRLLKEVCRQFFPNFKMSGTFVFIARRSAIGASFLEIQTALQRFFERQGFLETTTGSRQP